MVVDGLLAIAAEGLVALHLHLRRYRAGRLGRAVEKDLEVGLRDHPRPKNLRVAQLNLVLARGRVVGLRGKLKLADTLVVLYVALVLVAQAE